MVVKTADALVSATRALVLVKRTTLLPKNTLNMQGSPCI